jgi:multidrug efflux pump subunit AcrA (membrane-fusion protein)
VKQDDSAELRPVTVGQRHGDLIVIGQGLKQGERVVVNGQLGVTPGGKVQIATSGANRNPAVPAKSGTKS